MIFGALSAIVSSIGVHGQRLDLLSEKGLRVVEDVVYNHTYEHDSCQERTIPGCYYRHWDDGRLSDGSA